MANTVKAMREAEVKEIVEQLGGTRLQFIPEGRCGVRYARGGLDVPCMRAKRTEHKTLGTDPFDDKIFMSAKCRHHRGATNASYVYRGPAFVEVEPLGPNDELAVVGFAKDRVLDLVAQLPASLQYKYCVQAEMTRGATDIQEDDFDFGALRNEAEELTADRG